jgi:hypothetical protein
MLHLITDTSIFVSLPNECLCQMTGEHLMRLPVRPSTGPLLVSNAVIVHRLAPGQKRLATGLHGEERPKKRLRLYDPGLSGTISSTLVIPNTLQCVTFLKESSHDLIFCRCTPADISFVRSRLFYARPVRKPHTNHIVVGLPLKRERLNHESSSMLAFTLGQIY